MDPKDLAKKLRHLANQYMRIAEEGNARRKKAIALETLDVAEEVCAFLKKEAGEE